MNYKGAYRTAPATPSLINFPVVLLGRPIFSVKRPCSAGSVGNLPPQLPKLPSLSEKIKTVAKRRKIDMEEGGRRTWINVCYASQRIFLREFCKFFLSQIG